MIRAEFEEVLKRLKVAATNLSYGVAFWIEIHSMRRRKARFGLQIMVSAIWKPPKPIERISVTKK